MRDGQNVWREGNKPLGVEVGVSGKCASASQGPGIGTICCGLEKVSKVGWRG